MKSTQPCQVHIPWVGEPSLRSFVQFSPYLFFNVISKKCPKLSVSSDWGSSCLQDSWECLPAFALVSLSQCTPPCWLLTLCQHEKVHSTVAHLGFLPSWDNCELTVYKVIVLCYFNFGYIFSEFFYLQHNNIITDIWLSLIISLVYFSSQFKTLIPPKTNNIQSNY